MPHRLGCRASFPLKDMATTDSEPGEGAGPNSGVDFCGSVTNSNPRFDHLNSAAGMTLREDQDERALKASISRSGYNAGGAD
jgi:hypothetical protein